MNRFEIIPAIDLMDGKCVRLSQGDFDSQKVYGSDPVQVALNFENAGFQRLHIVDLDGARRGAVTNLSTLERIAAATNLTIDFGGGIKDEASLTSAFNAGAAMVSVGSLAARSPETIEHWIALYGADRFLLGADLRNGRIAVNGWTETTSFEVVEYLDCYLGRGITSAFVTDIAKDGLLAGPAIELYKTIIKKLPRLNLIASGGVSNIDDIVELRSIGCAGVIVGKAIYEGRIAVDELAALSI